MKGSGLVIGFGLGREWWAGKWVRDCFGSGCGIGVFILVLSSYNQGSIWFKVTKAQGLILQ